MIKIQLACDGKEVFDSFEHENSTLLENALIIRRLEEFKLKLLDEFEYKSKYEESSGDQIDGG